MYHHPTIYSEYFALLRVITCIASQVFHQKRRWFEDTQHSVQYKFIERVGNTISHLLLSICDVGTRTVYLLYYWMVVKLVARIRPGKK